MVLAEGGRPAVKGPGVDPRPLPAWGLHRHRPMDAGITCARPQPA